MDIISKINGYVPKEPHNDYFLIMLSLLSGDGGEQMSLKKYRKCAQLWGLENNKIKEYGKLTKKETYSEALTDHYVWLWTTQNICFW